MLERHQNKHKRRRYSTSSVGVLSLLDARVDGCQVVPESSSGELALLHKFPRYVCASRYRYESLPSMLPDLRLAGECRGKAFSSEIKVQKQTNWLFDVLSPCLVS